MFVMGIDPGRTGSICFRHIETRAMEFFELPYLETEPDIVSTRDLLKNLCQRAAIDNDRLKVYLEKAQSMPGNSGQGMLKYGRASGIIEGLLCGYFIPYELVTPRVWTKEVHAGAGHYVNAKHKSIIVAKRLFPHIEFKRTLRCTKDDEGRIDACLIAEYGARKELGTLTKSS